MRLRSAVGSVLAVLAVAACATPAPSRLRSPAARFSSVIDLPPADTHGTMPLDQAIERRRSTREMSSRALSLAVIGQLLWAAQGITSPDAKRAAPSAGGLYPIEMYVVTARQTMHYLPEGHRVEVRTDLDHRAALGDAAFGQSVVSRAPAVLVITAVPRRTRAKYGARADEFVALEAGHVAQNILLEATQRSLAATPVGGIDPERVRRVLALPPDYDVEYLVPVGYRD